MAKTVWINGTERLIKNKDKYGTYHLLLDDKDIKWLNSLKPSDNNDLKKVCSCGHEILRHTTAGCQVVHREGDDDVYCACEQTYP